MNDINNIQTYPTLSQHGAGDGDGVSDCPFHSDQYFVQEVYIQQWVLENFVACS